MTAPDYGPQAGEFSWGPGNVPPGCEDAPIRGGGAYRGTTPPAAPTPDLSALARELADRHTARDG
ncbi:hypothetical protein [Williamsia deligens]|uniref:Uncharacterized protein n=1 Tax=Williamsia deligens TaxID=321325 RepID=A0ABW3GCX1_9NOCA|nr:hypothetical protein [Williamsia deligens]